LATRPTYNEPGICRGPKNKTTTWGGGGGGIWLFQMHSLGCLTALNFAWSVCPPMHLFFDGAPQIVECASHGMDKEALQ